jgi:hypothetical protein
MVYSTTSLLDAFTRANESPIAGGWGSAAAFSTNALQVVSNAAKGFSVEESFVRTPGRPSPP